jgi:hypothetical protein
LAWLRRYPKLEASEESRNILLTINNARNKKDRAFIKNFDRWENRYGRFVLFLPSRDKVYGDLQRARSLILHALPDMFHYLDEQHIAATTNKLEGYFPDSKRYPASIGVCRRSIGKNHFAWYINF